MEAITNFVGAYQDAKKRENVVSNVTNTLKTIKDLRAYSGPTVRNQYELDASRRKYAHFASAAYEDVGSLKGYTLDRNISTPQFKVYTKEGEKKLVLACRGSAVMKDFLVSDVQVTRGEEAQQLKELRTFYDKVENKYGNYSKIGVGHSLSALSIARLQHETDGFKSVYSYNPASSPFGGDEYQNYLKEAYDNPTVRVTIKEGDAVSAPMLRYASNLQVIGNKGKLSDTVSHHFMNNFVENEHIKNISNLLDKHGVEGKSDIIHELHKKQKGDESLEKRHDVLKQKLEGGSALAINEGTYLASGGWHNTYNPTPNSLTIWTDPHTGKQHKVPGPGSKIYLNKQKGIMFTFGKNNEFIPLVGTLAQKSAALKRSKGYNQGPAVIYDSSKSPPERGVAAVPALGGKGLDFVDVTSPGKWIGALVGLDKGQLGGDGIKFLEGTKSKHGYVGNGMSNPFERIQNTINDQISDKGLDVAEWLGHNAVSLYQTGLEMAADALTLGTASVVIQGVNAVLNVTGGSDLAQAQVDRLIPDVRHEDMSNMNNIFKHAKDYETGTEDAFLSGSGYPDSRYIKDDRVTWRIGQLEKGWNALRHKAGTIGLTPEEEKKMYALHPHKIEDLDNQFDQTKKLDEFEKKYTFMQTSFAETKKVKEADSKAQRVGLEAVTKVKYDTLRHNMIPSEGVNSYSQSYYTQQTDTLLKTLNNTVKSKLATSPHIIEKYENKSLGLDSDATKTFMNKIASKSDYIRKYGTDNFSPDKFNRYQRDLLTAYKTFQGTYKAPNTEGMSKSDKFFYEKTKKPSQVSKNYFSFRKEEFNNLQAQEDDIRNEHSLLQTKEHQTREQIHEKLAVIA